MKAGPALAAAAFLGLLLAGTGASQAPCEQHAAGTLASLDLAHCTLWIDGDATVPNGAIVRLDAVELRFAGPHTLRVLGSLELSGTHATAAGLPYRIVFEAGSAGRLTGGTAVRGHAALTVASGDVRLDGVLAADAATGLHVTAADPVLASVDFEDVEVGLRVTGVARPLLRAATFTRVPQPVVLAPAAGAAADAPRLTVHEDVALPPAGVQLAGSAALWVARPVTVTVQGPGATGPVTAFAVDGDGVTRAAAPATGEPRRAELPVPLSETTSAGTRPFGPYLLAAAAGARVNHEEAAVVPDELTLVVGTDTDAGLGAEPSWPDAPLTQGGPRPGYSPDGRVQLAWPEPDEAQGHLNRALARYEVLLDCDADPCPPAATAATTRLTRAATLSGLADGLHRIRVRAVDLAGNHADSPELAVLVDRVLPGLTLAVLDATPAGPALPHGYTAPHRVAATAADAGSGLEAVTVQVDGGAVQAYTQPVALTEDGNHTVLVQAVDRAGNVRRAWSNTSLDRTAPSLLAALEPAPGTGGWSRKPLHLAVAAQDATTGVGAVRYRVDQGAWRSANATQPLALAQGLHTVEVEARDAVGNAAATQLVGGIDTTPPTVAASTPAAAGRNGWHLQPANVTVAVTDAGAGVAQALARIDNGTWSEFRSPLRGLRSGPHRIELSARDHAGNVANHTHHVRIDLDDPVPPHVTWTVAAEGALRADWASAPAYDASSGIARILLEQQFQGAPRLLQEAAVRSTGATVPNLPDGSHQVRVRVEDHAGRAAATPWQTVHVDDPAEAPPVPKRVARGTTTLGAPPLQNLTEARFYVDGELVAAVGQPPFRFEWDTTGLPDGTYQVRAVAADAAGVLTQQVVAYEVRNGYAAVVADNAWHAGLAVGLVLVAASASIAAAVGARRRLP